MSEKKLVSVDEYARMHGISKSKVYTMLKGSLSHCLVKKGGMKFIDISLCDKPEQEQPTFIEQQQAPEQQTESKEEPAQRKETVEDKEELERYRIEIERLQKELEEERRHSREKDSKMLDLMGRVMELTENTQKLTARVQEQQAMLQQSSGRTLLISDGTERKGLFGWFKRRK